MKKILSVSLCVVAAMLMTMSCTDKNAKTTGVLEQVPASADVVVVGNLKTIIESAGGSVDNYRIELPAYISQTMTGQMMEEFGKANEILESAHVDLESCAVFADFDDETPVVVVTLKDQDCFVTAIQSLGYSKMEAGGDMELYSKEQTNDSYVAVNGSYAYVLPEVKAEPDFMPAEYLQDIAVKASDKSFATTSFGKYISEGNAVGVSVAFNDKMQTMLQTFGMPLGAMNSYKGIVCVRGNLSSNKCVVEMSMFDEEGKEMKAEAMTPFMDNSSTVSKKAIALLGEKEYVAYALSLKDVDWNKYLDMVSEAGGLSRSARAQMNMVMNYLENIDGTVAMGFGLTNGMESIASMNRMGRDIMSQFSATMVIETKDGSAKKLLDDIKNLLEGFSVPFNESTSGLSVGLDMVGVPGTLYAECVGDFLVFANHEIKSDNDNIFVGKSEITDNRAAFYAELDKDNKLMRDLNLKDDVTLVGYTTPETMKGAVVFEIDGDSKTGFIAKVVDMVSGMTVKGM